MKDLQQSLESIHLSENGFLHHPKYWSFINLSNITHLTVFPSEVQRKITFFQGTQQLTSFCFLKESTEVTNEKFLQVVTERLKIIFK